jgi:hypothetical protein
MCFWRRNVALYLYNTIQMDVISLKLIGFENAEEIKISQAEIGR